MAMDIVGQAEVCIKNIARNRRGEISLTTSKIRKFLVMVTSLQNRVDIFKVTHPNEKELPSDLAMEIKFLIVSMAYEAGRDKDAKDFVEKAKLRQWVENIGNSTEKFDEFAKYVEALVAFHKFYGGRDN